MSRKQMKQILVLGCGTMVCAMVAFAADKAPSAPAKLQAVAPAAAATAPTVVSMDGKPVLSLQLPTGAVVKTTGDRTDVSAPGAGLFFQLWPVATAKEAWSAAACCCPRPWTASSA